MRSWQSIPIIIINRNRLGALKRLTQWALELGCNDVRIVDNNSNYPPLLTFYQNLPKEVSLIRLKKNLGPWAPWQCAMHKSIVSPYIVSDSDLVPSVCCPSDLIPRLADLLSTYPDCGKVGPGLRVDNISPSYGQATVAYRWESQFWHRPLADGMFSAPIDTTFALYPEGSDFNRSENNIRLGPPYLFDHTPWQVDERALDEEEIFYRAHTDQRFSNWSTAEVNPRISEKKAVKQFADRQKILHLSHDGSYIPGWINVNLREKDFDIRFDLNRCKTEMLPLENESIDGFYARGLFEFVENSYAVMQELYRIAKKNAIFHSRILVEGNADIQRQPYFSSSFLCFSQPSIRRLNFGYLADWRVDKITLISDSDFHPQVVSTDTMARLANQHRVREIVVELRAVKPARPRLFVRSDRRAEVCVTRDERSLPSFCG